MAEIGLSRAGMQYVASNVSSWNNEEWPASGHDLGRVFRYRGLEVKNTLAYMERQVETKLTMCRYFGWVPLVVLRFALRTWKQELHAVGGFGWRMDHQHYPHGAEAFAQEVSAELGLKVAAPRMLWDGTIRRLRIGLSSSSRRTGVTRIWPSQWGARLMFAVLPELCPKTDRGHDEGQDQEE